MTANEFLTDPYHFGEIAGESITKRRDSKMKKAMLSQPMNGKTDEEIAEARNRAIETLMNRGYEIVNTLFTDEWYSFCKGWENARGCRIEHEAAKAYGLEIIYEGDDDGNG